MVIKLVKNSEYLVYKSISVMYSL